MARKSKKFPVAKRPVEYVGLLIVQMSTMQGPAFVYVAIDAYSKFAFNLCVEKNDNPENVLKYIYLLTENSDFKEHMDKGFTLVLEKYEELSERINIIIKPVKGKLIFNKAFNNYITLPLLKDLRNIMLRR